MKHNCITLNNYRGGYLDDISNLPIYTSEGKRVISFIEGKIFENGCVHASEREAGKCYHDSYDWDNADDCLIMMEASP